MSLSLLSTAGEVQEFLRSRNFNEEIRNSFITFTGRAILGLDKETIIRRCNGDTIERIRLYSILNSIRQSLTTSSKLHYFLSIC